MQIADQSTRAEAWHLGHDEAVRIATDAADEHGLAETIYLTRNGFAVTNALSGILRDASVTVTILPARYFS